MFLFKKFKISNSGKGNEFICPAKLSKKNKVKFTGDNNKIKFGSNLKNGRLYITIAGSNNRINIGDNLKNRNKLIISIVGDNNTIDIGDNVQILDSLNICNLQDCQNGYIKISDNCAFYDSEFHLYDNHSSIEIGKDCMFAYNVVIHATDGHAIFQNGKLINKAEKCVIGNHVWLGRNALILKNSNIPDGCIVAANTTICKKYDVKNAVITNSGVVKTDIQWDRRTINEVLNEK